MNTWSVADSLKLYNIENWGGRYFNINPSGAMMVYPSQASGEGINLHRLVQEIAARGLGMPVVIRFQDILRHRVVELNEAFREAIREAGYRGRYQGVYPIKVNQMSEVVEEILDAGRPYDHGLEAGSKAELAAVLAMDTTPQSLIIVNGYKDYDIIKMALMGLKLGKRVLIVIEKLSELLHVVDVSKELGVFPLIGIRAKLYSKGSGKWESSGGEFAKFGLTTPEIIRAVRILVQEGMQESFKLLHFHIGSQITNIRTVKSAVKEATRIYSKLVKMGLNIEFLDVGGGLGVDYDGSRTNFNSSTNYSLREYVADVVYSIQEICAAEEVREPHIVSESGRALVAHHSVLVVNVFGHIEVANSNEADLVILRGGETEEADIVKEIRYLFQNISGKNLLEHFHDAVQRKEEAISMFNLGILSLEDRAKVETIFWYIAKAIYKKSRELKYIPEEVEDLHKQLADQYLCNFSVFQSMLDHWAIQHLFPIAPIHRMDEKPMRHATLADITCDSDGKVTKFIDLRDIKDTLPLHDLREGEPYYLGLFLMGAYQDIMGDMHNLFGRVNEVHVFLDETEPGGYYIEEVIDGSKVSDVLSLTQYTAPLLQKSIKALIDQKVKEGVIKPAEGFRLLNFYEKVLYGYTYMETQSPMRMGAIFAPDEQVGSSLKVSLDSDPETSEGEYSDSESRL